MEGSVIGTCGSIQWVCFTHANKELMETSSLFTVSQYGVGIVTWIACDHCKLHVWYQLCSIRARSHCFSLVSIPIPFVWEEFGVPAFLCTVYCPEHRSLAPSLPLRKFTLLFQETQSHINDCCYALPPASLKYALPEMSSSQSFVLWEGKTWKILSRKWFPPTQTFPR